MTTLSTFLSWFWKSTATFRTLPGEVGFSRQQYFYLFFREALFAHSLARHVNGFFVIADQKFLCPMAFTIVWSRTGCFPASYFFGCDCSGH